MKKTLFFAGIIFLLSHTHLMSQTRPNIPITGVPNQPFASLREVMLSKSRGWDAGLIIGSAHALADIGGTRDSSRILFFDAQWRASGIHYGAYARYRFSEIYALAGEINYGLIGGADSLSPITSSRYDRAYYFSNDLYEIALKNEFYMPQELLGIPVNFYAFLGVAALYHNPSLFGPEGPIDVSDGYVPVQLVIPMGIGFHYTSVSNFKIGFNVGWRKTFTDHLDGISPKSGPDKDAYFYNGINLGYYFCPKMGKQN